MMQAWIWLGEIYQVEEKEARNMKVIVAEKARTISNDRKRKADQDEYSADIEKKMRLMYDIQWIRLSLDFGCRR